MSEKAIGMPKTRIVSVDMADRDGALDLSEVMRGRVSYGNRPLSFAFICTARQSTWEALRSEIAGFIHGKRMQIEDPDTPGQYYIGRCTLHEPSYKGEAIMFLTVTVDADPYRLDLTESTVTLSGERGASVNLPSKGMPSVPTVTASADVEIRLHGVTYALTGGTTYRIPEMVLVGATNVVTIMSGSATVTFTYRQGDI